MGKADVAVNRILERKDVFADLVNGIIYEGRQVVRPEKLEHISGRSGIIYTEKGKKAKALERYGDIRMKADVGTYSVIFSNENQMKVHYAMPVRSMLYDALEYTKQIEELEKSHRKSGDSLKGDAFLSGITKTDRLSPVITIVLYFGECWDGAKSLYEMIGISDNDETVQVLKKYLPDYTFNLVCVRDIANIDWFHSCLQHIFGMLKWKKNKKELYQYLKDNQEALKKFDYVEMMAAMTLLGEEKRISRFLENRKNGEEEFDVCQAIDDLIADGKMEGVWIGQTKINSLNQKLKADGRIDDLMRSVDDLLFQKKLLNEYGL